MAKYKILVFCIEDNPEYEAQMAKFKEDTLYNRNRMYNGSDEGMPQKERASRSLEVVLTEEEYAAVKQSVLTTFK